MSFSFSVLFKKSCTYLADVDTSTLPRSMCLSILDYSLYSFTLLLSLAVLGSSFLSFALSLAYLHSWLCIPFCLCPPLRNLYSLCTTEIIVLLILTHPGSPFLSVLFLSFIYTPDDCVLFCLMYPSMSLIYLVYDYTCLHS